MRVPHWSMLNRVFSGFGFKGSGFEILGRRGFEILKINFQSLRIWGSESENLGRRGFELFPPWI